jgi:hypothetical protein
VSIAKRFVEFQFAVGSLDNESNAKTRKSTSSVLPLEVSIFQVFLELREQGWFSTGYSECVRQDHAARREYELMTPPSFDVQTMSFTDTVQHSAGATLKSGGKCSRDECGRSSL